MAGWLSKIAAPFVTKSTEGGAHWTMEGIIPSSWDLNFWQEGYDPLPYGAASAVVEACLGAYSQTVAMCPGDHWRELPDGGRERVKGSALTRVLKRPNAYQSISDFLLNLVRCLYDEGNAYAVAFRNGRGEIEELHLMSSRASAPRVAMDGSIFYSVGGNQVVDQTMAGMGLSYVPARDVLHLRLATPRHPLIGESPLIAAALDVGLSNQMKRSQWKFFQNGGRPSAVITTDQKLDKDQAEQVRTRWNEHSKGMAKGGVPILTNGMKIEPWAQTSVDAQLAETLKMSDQAIALTYRVPLAILGIGGQTYSSTEQLMNQWVASGLGFVLNHIEEGIGNLFELRGQPDEYLEFGTDALLRSAFKERIEAIVAGVHGGIFSPNEARAKEGLPPVKDGDEPRLQQQDVPLSWAADQQRLAEEQAKKPDPAPAPVAAPSAPDTSAANDDEPKPAAKPAKTYRDRRRHLREQNVRSIA